MLKKIGFKYKNQVDPFDGGPHLWAGVDEISPIKKIANYSLEDSLPEGADESGLISKSIQKSGEFRAVSVQVRTQEGRLALLEPSAEKVKTVLGMKAGEQVVFMPYY